MTILVVGASGATGRLLVEQLLNLGHSLRIVVRAGAILPDNVRNHRNLSRVRANILDLADSEMAELVTGCEAVASCLGHNLSFKGIYGKPRRLVTDATRRLCGAIGAVNPDTPVRFVLMSSTGNRNLDLDEPISIAHRFALWLLRMLVPPHADNEDAANYLRTGVGQKDAAIEWVAVRPDTLVDESEVSGYETHMSPTRSAIFDAGTTSRINVAHFMAELITDRDTWLTWKGQMPVIYNNDGSVKAEP